MDEKTVVDESTSAQRTLPPTHDPGWNDPPEWAFSPTLSTGGSSQKRLLNKRIAFPLNSESAGSKPAKDQAPLGFTANRPPPVQSTALTSAPHRPLGAPTGKVESSRSEEMSVDRIRALDETMENLETTIKTQLERSNETEEVGRRLNVMRTMWKENKLEDAVCAKVLELSRELMRNDAEAADKIHVSLMMEHTAACNAWIFGIRHMIHVLRGKSAQPSLATAQNERPYLLPQSTNEDKNQSKPAI